MASLKYEGNSNFQTGTLGSSYTSGGTSVSLTSGHGARFPSSGDFWIRIEDEILKVTARSTDTLTVVGAQDGTTAANHASGVSVYWVLGKSALDQLRGDLVLTGTYSSLPSASSVPAGTLYSATDSVYELIRSNGSSWKHFKGGVEVTTPPTSGWTTINGSSETFDTTRGSLYLQVPAAGSDNIRGRVASVTAPYKVTLLVSTAFNNSNYVAAGILARQSSDGKLIVFGQGYNSGQGGKVILSYYHDSPTGSGFSRGSSIPFDRDWIWLQIEDDNTNRVLRWSIDGFNWIQFSSNTRTTDITANQIGFFCNSANGTIAAMIVASYKTE